MCCGVEMIQRFHKRSADIIKYMRRRIESGGGDVTPSFGVGGHRLKAATSCVVEETKTR
jgi:hypothetical protein